MKSKVRVKETGSLSLMVAAVLIASTLASVSFFMADGTLQESVKTNRSGCDLSGLAIASANYSRRAEVAQVELYNPSNLSLEKIRVSLFANQSLVDSVVVPKLAPGNSSQIVWRQDSLSNFSNGSYPFKELKVTAIPLHCPTLMVKQRMSSS